MIVAVSAAGPSLDAPVDPRFGRCAYLIFVETDDMSFESIANVSNCDSSGAGTRTAQAVAGKGAKIVLTGRVGGNAQQALTAAGIEVATDCTGCVADAVMRFKGGRPDAKQMATPRTPDAANHG